MSLAQDIAVTHLQRIGGWARVSHFSARFIPFPEAPESACNPPEPLGSEPPVGLSAGGRGGGLRVACCGECGRDPSHPAARSCDFSRCPIRHHAEDLAA